MGTDRKTDRLYRTVASLNYESVEWSTLEDSAELIGSFEEPVEGFWWIDQLFHDSTATSIQYLFLRHQIVQNLILNSNYSTLKSSLRASSSPRMRAGRSTKRIVWRRSDSIGFEKPNVEKKRMPNGKKKKRIQRDGMQRKMPKERLRILVGGSRLQRLKQRDMPPKLKMLDGLPSQKISRGCEQRKPSIRRNLRSFEEVFLVLSTGNFNNNDVMPRLLI